MYLKVIVCHMNLLINKMLNDKCGEYISQNDYLVFINFHIESKHLNIFPYFCSSLCKINQLFNSHSLQEIDHIKKQPVLLLLFLLFNFNLLNLVWGNLILSKDTESLDILIVVPASSNSCIRLQPKWERGDEILPGAEIVVDEINDSPNLLSTCQLNIVPIRVELCNPLINIESFVGNLTSRRNKVIGIVGYFCDNLVQFLSPQAGHNNFGVIQISAMPPISQNSDRKVSRFYHVLPSPCTG